MSFAKTFLEETKRIINELDTKKIDLVAQALAEVRDGGGRVFFLGVGGSAANCSHAVNDFLERSVSLKPTHQLTTFLN